MRPKQRWGSKHVALTLVSPLPVWSLGGFKIQNMGYFLVLRSSPLVNGLAVRQCSYFLMLLAIERLTNQRFFLDSETRISGDLWSNKLLPSSLLLPSCFRLVSNHRDFQYEGEGKRGGGYLRGKMKFLWQGSCHDPCLARAGALLGLPSPWVPLDPSFGLGASSLGLRLHLSKRNKSNTNLLFVSLACTPLIGSQVVGGGVGKVFDLLH